MSLYVINVYNRGAMQLSLAFILAVLLSFDSANIQQKKAVVKSFG